MDWGEVPVHKVMSSPVREVDGRLAVAEAARILCEEHIGSVVVRKRTDGILTDTDIVRGVRDGVDPEETMVAELMSSPVVTVDPDATLQDAAELMADHDIKKLLVDDGDEYAGIVTTTDIVHQLSPDLEQVLVTFATE